MPKTGVISARFDPHLKRDAETAFDAPRLTATQAITLFYRQVEIEHGLPFQVRLPNEATRTALEEAQTRQNLESFDTLDDLFDDLEI